MEFGSLCISYNHRPILLQVSQTVDEQRRHQVLSQYQALTWKRCVTLIRRESQQQKVDLKSQGVRKYQQLLELYQPNREYMMTTILCVLVGVEVEASRISIDVVDFAAK